MLIPLAILAASAFAKHEANQDAIKRQRSIAGAMEAYQRSRSKLAERATQDLTRKQAPESRATELADLTRQRADSMRESVGAAQAFDQPVVSGNLSDDFKRTQDAEAQSIAARTKRAIEQLAAMGAPAEAKQAHQLRFGRAAGEVDAANRASDNVGRAYMTDINSVRPNDTLSLLSDIGMTAGSAMLLGGAGAGAGAGADVAAAGTGVAPGAAGVRAAKLARGFSLWGA